VSITFEESLDLWQDIAQLTRGGAPAAATAMARYVALRTAEDTLRQSSHAPGEWYRQGPGRPPAYASGNLASSMYVRPAHSGMRATAIAGNDAEYSRILEFGCVIVPVNKKFLHWTDTGGSWYHTILVVPPHPYLGPTTEAAIRDGDLQEEAIEAFRPYDP
jgi:hypothetical protein